VRKSNIRPELLLSYGPKVYFGDGRFICQPIVGEKVDRDSHDQGRECEK